MNRCSRCNQPSLNALLCDECQNQLRGQFRHISLPAVPQTERMLGGNATEPHIAVLPEQRDRSSNLSEHITHPQPVVSAGAPKANIESRPATTLSSLPSVSSSQGTYASTSERVIDRLSEAAQRIAEEESIEPLPHKRPRASRLAPLRDISADIRRESTPSIGALSIPPSASDQFPSIVDTPEIAEEEKSIAPSEQDQDLGQHMPDLWPWLLEADPEESETDTWANRTDPLTLRHFPDSSEAARIEEEDIRRAMAEGAITAPVLPSRRRRRSSRLRFIFVLLTILAMVALVVDGILLSAALLRPHRHDTNSGGPATLTLSTHAARIGDKVIVHISHFAPLTHVLLTHDIEEPVQLAPGSSAGTSVQHGGASIPLDANGNASVSILIDTSWGPGFHPLDAEDVTTHYTASAQLQIIGDGQTRPSHLLIDPLPALLNRGTLLDMGADYQGVNTIKLLTLRNSGDGTPISWTASSNRPWLMIAPAQGTFSATQTISVAVDRANLKPGTYHDGVITLSSNVGGLPPIAVEMSVKPLPPNPGPVLAVTPAVLSFTASDGGPSPAAQSLTISNPGTQALHWSLTGNNPLSSSNDTLSEAKALGVQANWLSSSPISGTVLPHTSESVQVNVNSRSLLPGTYTSALVFSPTGKAYDSAQTVNVSLTVQPQCGLATSTGSLSFTAVAGQSNPTNSTLGLSAAASCATAISWTAISSAGWLSVTPNKGRLNGTGSTVTSIAVNASGLAPSPSPYTATIAFLTQQSTQTVAVQLTVQPKPSAAAPIIALSGLTLNFSSTQGQSTSTSQSQVVTITNTGGGTLYWHTKIVQLTPTWLGSSPTGNSIPAGHTGQLSVNVNTAGLTPGTYVGQITLLGQDASGNPASGSPQTITVNLLVLPPCLLAPASSSSLVFNAIQGGTNPAPQTVQITASGNCNWPVTLHASVSSGASWLKVTPSAPSIAVSGQSMSLVVAPSVAGISAAPAPYTAQVTISATDSVGISAQGSPQSFSVSLSVAPPVSPCQLNVTSTNLAFTATASAVGPQSVTLSESGSCAYPISWTATPDAGSSAWLTASPSSGEDTGTTSTLTVSVNPTSANLAPGTYTGQIAVSATNAGATALQGSPQTITVTLTVPGFTVSGTVFACADSTCATPVPLPGATITVLNGSNQLATTTADLSGNYTLPALAPGTYTFNVSGTDSSNNHYTGTLTLTVTADQTNVAINALLG